MFETIKTRGLVLLGCGKMGSAMLQGWLEQGLPPSAVTILDPQPSDWVKSTGARINTYLPENPAICIIAVKPQMPPAPRFRHSKPHLARKPL